VKSPADVGVPAVDVTAPKPALAVHGLSVRFHTGTSVVSAVTDLAFDLHPGECLALVGESGCGKSVLAHAILGLLPANAEVRGSARLGDLELICAPERTLARTVRGRRLALVPQSPASHLTPVRTVGSQLVEALRELGLPAPAAAVKAESLLQLVGLDGRTGGLYPHELSGGMAQRVANAIALAGDPEVIIADEPTSGLDRALVDLTMAELRRRCDEGRAVLLITHDLAAAERMADRVAVMYASRLVEVAWAAGFFARPSHPYARGLLDALPTRAFASIPGHPPELTALPDGCAFASRCALAGPDCAVRPALRAARGPGGAPRHGGDTLVACHRVPEGA
jgi:peptide/nickel transport system ATP-binding protein